MSAIMARINVTAFRIYSELHADHFIHESE
jgi:hypothetical protein